MIFDLFRRLYITWRAVCIMNYRILRWDEYLSTLKKSTANGNGNGNEKADDSDYSCDNAQKKGYLV